jgi:hypothetical protein
MRSRSFSNATFFIFLLRVGKPKSMADGAMDASKDYEKRGRFDFGVFSFGSLSLDEQRK